MVNFGSIPFNLRKDKYKHYQFLKDVNRDIVFRGDSNVQWNGGMNHSHVSWDMYLPLIDNYETWNRSKSSGELYELGLIKKRESYKRYLDTFNWFDCNDETEQIEILPMSERWDLIL